MIHPMPMIPKQQYHSFRGALGTDIPDTYDEWLNLTNKLRNERIRQGEVVPQVEIDFDEFTRFCAARGTTPNNKALLDLAIEKSRR